MNLHPEVLSAEQRDVLRRLAAHAAEFSFYLGGGTAVAIHLGHRQSVDLDWFTRGRIERPAELARDFQDRGLELQVESVERGTLHGSLGGVRLSFLEFGYPLLQSPVHWRPFHCDVAAIDDLAAMKLLAVAQRGSKKDFLDVYAFARQGLSLERMLELYRQKFSVADVSRVLYSLCYFDDADSEPMPRMLTDVAWTEVKTSLQKWVRTLAGARE